MYRLIYFIGILLVGYTNSYTTKKLARSFVEEFVEQKVISKTVVVFSKSTCPHSARVKQILGKFNISPMHYEIVEIDKRTDGSEIQTYMIKRTGAGTVPRVFIGGKFIGGSEDVIRLENNGQLRNILEISGAI